MIEAIEVTITAMAIVFLILIILLGVLKLLNYLPKEEVTKAVEKPVATPHLVMEDLDEDIQAAVLAAIIDYSEDVKKEIRVIKIKEA